MKTFKSLLIELRACEDAVEWANDMSIEEVVLKCDRGNWLLWLAKKVNVDLRLLTLAKMKNQQQTTNFYKEILGNLIIDKVNTILIKQKTT